MAWSSCWPLSRRGGDAEGVLPQPDADQLIEQGLVVSEGDAVAADGLVGADGTVRRATMDTAGRADADRWEQLAASAHLEVPPPYWPEPGNPVYQVRVGTHVAGVAERNLSEPLGTGDDGAPEGGSG